MAMKAPILSPSRTVVTNFGTETVSHDRDALSSYDETIWVLEVAASNDWVACGLSNGDVNVYDQERLLIKQKYSKVHGKSSKMTDLTYFGDNILATSSANGQVCLMDVRQPSPALVFSLPRREEALSVTLGYDGVLAAVGSNKSHVHFFDIRSNGTLMGTYQDAHTDEVTRVRFQSPQSPLLISASEDGLACIFDTSKPSEEAALKSVLNVNTPLRKVGFFGPSLEGVYCLTGSETLSVWHHDSAQRICDFGVDIRQKLTNISGGMTIDYLVDCQWYQQELTLMAGNHDGDSALFRVDAGALTLTHLLRGGHRGDIRSWCPLSNNSAMIVTVGEDARMCEWNRLNHQLGSANGDNGNRLPRTAPAPTRGGGPLRRPKTKTHAAPY